ncbi:MAG: sodium:calcium antiporter [Gaiellaceae bacterium]
MDIAVQAFLVAGGLLVAVLASQRAVTYATATATALGVPPFLVGLVLVSIGTDLPEIANSVVAHLEGEGDINVGDSVGSALTQYTLVLGLFPFFAGTLRIVRREILVVGVLTVLAFGLVLGVVSDGRLTRLDGVVLVAAWIGATAVLLRLQPRRLDASIESAPRRVWGRQSLLALIALAVVGLGATVAVRALIRISEITGVPQFLIAFFGASLGTSAPELAVTLTALSRGAPAIAIGDAVGSSLADATLSIGSGPLVAAADVTRSTAILSTSYAMAAVGLATAILLLRNRLDRGVGAGLIALYAMAYAVVLGLG